MKPEFRSDLAVERRRADTSLPGTELTEEHRGAFTVTRLAVKTEGSAEAVGGAPGHYVTVSFPDLTASDGAVRRALTDLLAEEMRTLSVGLLGRAPRDGVRVVAVGLGNRALTSDAVGPMTVERIGATGQLETLDPECLGALGCASVFCNIPGVLADSGMEAADAVRLLTESLRPSLVIAVDALAARASERLCTTVQLADNGIAPGSGIGNRRRGLDLDSLGVPVLAIGVPTVMDASRLGGEGGAPLFITLKDVDVRLRILAPLLAEAVSILLGLPYDPALP